MNESYSTSSYNTGIAPPGFGDQQRRATEKDKVNMWFIEPINRMSGDDAIACLMLCFPLLEAVIRYELEIADDLDVPFSHGSPALKWFAKFMTIPEANARAAWDAFRNGLAHRAMMSSAVGYTLTGKRIGRPAEFKDGRTYIYVWDFRDAVLAKIAQHHSKLWKGTSSPLPLIHLEV